MADTLPRRYIRRWQVRRWSGAGRRWQVGLGRSGGGVRRILPEGWVEYARTEVAVDPEPPHFGYGAHWWIWRDQPGSLAAHGYEGQYIIVVPERDLVVVHLAKVPADVRSPLLAQLNRVINAFPLCRAAI